MWPWPADSQHILYRSREEPDVLAEQEFSPDEIEATLLLREQEYGKFYPRRRQTVAR